MIRTHGVWLPRLKEPAASEEILTLNSGGRLYVPLCYGEGEAELLVRPYETVVCGQPLSRLRPPGGGKEPGDAARTEPQAAPVTGVFLGRKTVTHPLLGEVACAELDCVVGESEQDVKTRLLDDLTAADVLEIARLAGVVDETDGRHLYDKLLAAQGAGYELLLADGIENQPYSSSAWAVLDESARKVETGLQLAAYAAGIPRTRIGVMLPGRRARALSEKLVSSGLARARGRYPHVRLGLAERRSEATLTVGVQALLALYRAALYEEPHITAVVTVAGDAVKHPRNVRAPFGTPVSALLAACGLRTPPEKVRVALGDAMTGVAVTSPQTPVAPGVTCVLAMTAAPEGLGAAACSGCGRCVQVCAAGLMPFKIMRKLVSMQYERLPALHPERCLGCGACSYICPAGLELSACVEQARDIGGSVFYEFGEDGDG